MTKAPLIFTYYIAAPVEKVWDGFVSKEANQKIFMGADFELDLKPGGAMTWSGPNKDGKPMRDNNVLVRFIKPAGRRLGIEFVNWRSLRTSYATWLIEAGANPKDVQGQMRHSRIATTMDIYAQFVPESQQRAISKMTAMVEQRLAAKHATDELASHTIQ